MSSYYKNIAAYYNYIFDANKDVVVTVDYTCYTSYNSGVPDGGIVIGFLPYYRIAPDGTVGGDGLGYSRTIDLSSTTGILDAHFGVAVDFNGKFVNTNAGTQSITSFAPNSISLRGPASDQYPLLSYTANLTSVPKPFLTYNLYDGNNPLSAVESKRIRVQLTDFGSRLIVGTKNANEVEFVERLNHISREYNTADYVRMYCAFCANSSATHIAVQNINVNGYDVTLTYTYSAAYYLGMVPNPATLTETQLLSVVNTYPPSLTTSFSGLGDLILINNADSGAPYVADNISLDQRYNLYTTPSAQDSFIFITYQ